MNMQRSACSSSVLEQLLLAFRSTSENAPAIAQICQRLDGIPSGD